MRKRREKGSTLVLGFGVCGGERRSRFESEGDAVQGAHSGWEWGGSASRETRSSVESKETWELHVSCTGVRGCAGAAQSTQFTACDRMKPQPDGPGSECACACSALIIWCQCGQRGNLAGVFAARSCVRGLRWEALQHRQGGLKTQRTGKGTLRGVGRCLSESLGQHWR